MTTLRSTLALAAAAVTLTPAVLRAQDHGTMLEHARLLLDRSVITSEQSNENAYYAAAEAALILSPLVQQPDASCDALLYMAEAQLRLADPIKSRTFLERALGSECDLPTILRLMAFSLEFNDDGVRRGSGADLSQALQTYEQLADLLIQRGQPDEHLQGALGNAAELAEVLGDRERCARWSLVAVKKRPAADVLQRQAATFLRCSAPLVGEGSSLDQLSEVMDRAMLLTAVDERKQWLQARLKQVDDPVALTGLATYSLLGGDEVEIFYARRFLDSAAGIDDDQPDLWYLRGRANERLGDVAAAVADYRRQLAERPGTPASRITANDLAHLLASIPGTDDELVEALKLIDAELAKTPDEPAMHDTRARVLLAMGRKREALSAFDQALAIKDDPAVRHEASQLRAQLEN